MKILLPEDFKKLNADNVPDWVDFEMAMQHPPITSIRIHPEKGTIPKDEDGVPWCPNGYYLKTRPSFGSDPLFAAGAYYVQEASSMLLCHALNQLEPDTSELRVLDLCAAPGGKSTVLLDWLNHQGLLVSNEVIGKRARVLEENLDKWGYANRVVTQCDSEQFAALGPQFDVVLVDAPCSGEGMFRKDADALNMWSVENVKHCHQRQCRILENAAQCLKPGGVLLYSTCTYNTVENEESLRHFVQLTEGDPVTILYPDDWNLVSSSDPETGGVRCFPHRLRGEGFFLGAVRMPGKLEPHDNKKATKNKSKKRKSTGHSAAAAMDVLVGWLNYPEKWRTHVHRDEHYILPAEFADWTMGLATKLHVLSAGLKMGKIIRHELIPDHNLALSPLLSRTGVKHIEMNAQEIATYLEKGSQQFSDYPDGLYLVTHQQAGMGWAKVIRGQLKNRYPTHLRWI